MKYGKFEVLIEEPISHREVGYEFHRDDERIIDEDLWQEVVTNVGENYARGLLDDLYDMPLICRGEDGEPYAVTLWNFKPFCWQRLYKVG